MSFINEIKKTLNITDEKGNRRGWLIKYDKKNNIQEVIQLYNPQEHTGKVLNDEELIGILTEHKRTQHENRNN